ncbi:LysM peptidoglycan-binding domain-containing protein [Aureibacter tunicatorum]|uniref:LysM domain-containing protein n=1 Tax=Aureibacter tunicatorum TaxID=866807 RepID=A0AAE4BT41_9BACT|nr:LysM domain-containing protein [Aureibacter tunicatorum]MDR6241824.1 hypothetical protein [Aureibacter tunicatorum]BDD07071.1 hypothetical protein AUTU_45540 [Aureibacter tunicatorum]
MYAEKELESKEKNNTEDKDGIGSRKKVKSAPSKSIPGKVYYQIFDKKYYYHVASGDNIYGIASKVGLPDISNWMSYLGFSISETGKIIDSNGVERWLEIGEAIAVPASGISDLSPIIFDGVFKGAVRSYNANHPLKDDQVAESFDPLNASYTNFNVFSLPASDSIELLNSTHEDVESQVEELLELTNEEKGVKLAKIAPYNAKLVKRVIDETSAFSDNELVCTILSHMSTAEIAACSSETLDLFYKILDTYWGSTDFDDQMMVKIKPLIRERKQIEESRTNKSYDTQKLAADLKKASAQIAQGNLTLENWLRKTLILLNQDSASEELVKASYLGNFDYDMSQIQMAIHVRSEDSFIYVPQKGDMLNGEVLMIGNSMYYQIGSNDTLGGIISKLGVNKDAVMELNGWESILKSGKVVPKGLQGRGRWLHPSERIKIPDAFQLEKLTHYWYSDTENGEFVRKGVDNRANDMVSQAQINILKDQIINILDSESMLDRLDEGKELVQKTLKGQPVHEGRFMTAFLGTKNVPFDQYVLDMLKKKVHIEFDTSGKDILLRNDLYSEYTRQRNNTINSYISSIDSWFVDFSLSPLQKMEAFNNQKEIDEFHSGDVTVKTGAVSLWENNSMAKLVAQAKHFMAPCLKSPYHKKDNIDLYPLFQALASLRLKASNIKVFLEEYGGRDAFLKDIDKAKCLVKTPVVTGYYTFGMQRIGFEYREKQLFSDEEKNNIIKYLTPKVISRKEVLEDKSHQFNLLSDGTAPNFSEFEQGEFIINQNDANAASYYVVKDGDTPHGLASKYGMSFSQMVRLNEPHWKAIHKDGRISFAGGKTRYLKPGEGIRVSRSAVMQAPYYYHLMEGRAFKMGKKKIEHFDGAWEFDENSFDPDVFENIVMTTFGKEHSLNKDSGSLSFKIYLRGEIVVAFYFEIGVKAEASVAVGDDRSFEVKKSIKLYLKEGVDLGVFSGEAEQKLKGIGGTDVYESVKQFVVEMNHNVYVMYLQNGAYSSDMISYWDDEENRDILYKEHQKLSKTPPTKLGASKKEGSLVNHSYSSVEGKKYVGDRSEENKSDRSEDFYKKNGSSAQLINAQLYDSNLLSIEYSKVKHDSNSDNDGDYITATLTLSKNSLKTLYSDIKGGAEQLKEGSFWSSKAKGIVNNSGLLDLIKTISKALPDKNGGRDLRKSIVQIRDENKGKSKALKILGKTFRTSSDSDWDVGIEIVSHFVNDGGYKLQFTNVNGFGEFSFGVSAQASYAKIVTLKAGFEAEVGLEQMIYESPGTDTLTYISTIYNALKYRSDKMDERQERERIMSEAQCFRNEKWQAYQASIEGKSITQQEQDKRMSAFEDEELKYIQDHYWIDYETDESPAWQAYRERYNTALNEMARKFFTPIFTAKDKSTWDGIDLMTVDGDFMRKYAEHESPQEMINTMGSIDLKDANFSNLESFVLIHLYKKHQKYAYDYYKYSDGISN